VFWVVVLASLRDKSVTADELGHAVAGYTYWRFGDYRLDPENGILPQRIMGLALATGPFQPPPREGDLWHGSEQWALGDVWFHQLGNDVSSILRRGRAAMGLVAVALGALVWWSARRLFGALGGMLALLLYVANPTTLANGALMTSDATAALFFLAAVIAFWAALRRVTILRVLVSGLLTGALFASKGSAALMIPIVALVILVRLLRRDPLTVSFGRMPRSRAALPRAITGGAPVPPQATNTGEMPVPRRAAAAGGTPVPSRDRQITTPLGKLAVLLAVVAAHVVIIWFVIWACYGFRYSTFASPTTPQDRLLYSWDFVLGKPDPGPLLGQLDLSAEQQSAAGSILGRYNLRQDGPAALDVIGRTVLSPSQAERLRQLRAAPAPSFVGRTIEAVRRHHLLPEPYLYGWANMWRFSQRRAAFWNGDFSVHGWRLFFPYTFLVKTPLPVFGIILLAVAALVAKWRCRVAAVRSMRAEPDENIGLHPSGSHVGGVPSPRDPSFAEQRSLWAHAWDSFYSTAPLWCLLAVYWPAAMASRLNIGHRHILPTYAPLLVLCGAAAWWLERRMQRHVGLPSPATLRRAGPIPSAGLAFDSRGGVPSPRGTSRPFAFATFRAASSWPGILLVALVLAAVVDVAAQFPNYIPYFNGLVTPSDGYRHLTDSSVDWGQDLPAVKRYLDEHPQARPAYLSYSGIASPRYYAIAAQPLYSTGGFDEPRVPIRVLHATLSDLPAKVAEARRAWPDCRILGQTSTPDGRVTVYFLRDPVIPVLTGGTYFVSATMLSTVPFGTDGVMGPWNPRFEATYQDLSRAIAPLCSDDVSLRGQAVLAYPVPQWVAIFEQFAQYRFARLAAFLRQRQPDTELGHSILVYRLTDEDIRRALSGPPPELGVDVPAKLAREAD
jgi:hypothetical protein